MPERPSKDWHEPFLKEMPKTRNVDNPVSAGSKRVTAFSITDKTLHLPTQETRPRSDRTRSLIPSP